MNELTKGNFMLCLKDWYFEAYKRGMYKDADFIDRLLLEYLLPKEYEKWNNKEKIIGGQNEIN